MRRHPSHPAALQSGLTLSGFVGLLAVVGVAVAFGMKVVPAWIEYHGITKAIKSMASTGDLAKPIPQIREAFDKRAEVGYITVISGQDLTITRVGDNTHAVSFAYRKEIPIVANMSVVFDFSGGAGDTGRKRVAAQ